ncbi:MULTISPECIES: ABC transporter substrate-binding protein [Rhodomicrobium]|uniref:heme/hemin ABC transporter substrate-binding protein n=1 Tax=Rhodomicrobium TaxID=1068 RepID=UPI001AECA928|nr:MULTISPECIES: ABC transporter substrate-binding protein [Rhodomicrobium]
MNQMLRFCLLIASLALLATAPARAEDGPKRVVALGSEITEIVDALGETKRLVGRDSTSLYPPEVTALPDVGYVRQLGAEGVLSLRPDLILASATAGPPEVLAQIRSAGVPIVQLSEAFTLDSLLKKVADIAKALQVEARGAELSEKLRRDTQEAEAAVAKMEGHPKVLFIIAAAGGAPMAAGRQTGADAMIALAGGENVFAEHTGYKAVSLEAAAAAAPDAIAMMAHTLDNMGGATGVATNPALKLTPAAKTRRIVAREGGYLLAFGPRLPQAITDFAKAIRSEAAQ